MRIQIHPMLQLNSISTAFPPLIFYSNTSHVIVKRTCLIYQDPFYPDSNTSHVIVKLPTKYIRADTYTDSNTSHVIVKRGGSEDREKSNWIQIHPMLQLNSESLILDADLYYSNTSHVIVKLTCQYCGAKGDGDSNTSHVIVKLNRAERRRVEKQNSNTSHVIVKHLRF